VVEFGEMGLGKLEIYNMSSWWNSVALESLPRLGSGDSGTNVKWDDCRMMLEDGWMRHFFTALAANNRVLKRDILMWFYIKSVTIIQILKKLDI